MEETKKSGTKPMKKSSATTSQHQEKEKPSTSSDRSSSGSEESTSAKCSTIVELMCRYCRKLCFSNEELAIHEKTHLDNKKLMCRLCGKGFARRSYLSEHMLIHSGVCPWKCESCPKTFALRCNLVRHTRVHSGEKPFKCELCSKRFTLKKNMQEHRLTHTKEKPFCCPQCARKFARRSSLVRHARTHTDSRTFECAHCGKKFPWRYYLQRHLLNKHEDPPKTKLPPKKRMRRTKAQIARDKAAKEAEKLGKAVGKAVEPTPALGATVPAGHEIKIEEGEEEGSTTRVFVSSTPVVGGNYEFEPEGIKEERLVPEPVDEESDQDCVAQDLSIHGRENQTPLANRKETEGAIDEVEIKEEVLEVGEEIFVDDKVIKPDQTRIPFPYGGASTSVITFGCTSKNLMEGQRPITVVNIPHRM